VAFTENTAFDLISSAHERERLSHAFLIMGSIEAGTHRLASRMVDLVNGEEPSDQSAFDMFGEATIQPNGEPKELDDLTGELVQVLRPRSKSRIINVDSIRDFEKPLYQSSPSGKWKVGIIVDADRMNDAAANAFLKTLEEPPQNTLLLLITSNPEQLLTTILSRCINVKLIDESNERPLNEAETDLLQAISSACKRGFGSTPAALTLKSAFASLLTSRKNKISKANDAALKEEEQHYAKTTEGDWLKRREEYYKALTESEYLLERSKLMDVMVTWLGDIVRAKCGHEHFDYPSVAKLTKQLADQEPLEKLLRRMDALEQLRSSLETNAQELLALEVGFMRAFG